MLIICKKTYTITVVVQEGNDEFWEALRKNKKTGCDEVVTEIAAAINERGFHNALVRLTQFSESPPINTDE